MDPSHGGGVEYHVRAGRQAYTGGLGVVVGLCEYPQVLHNPRTPLRVYTCTCGRECVLRGKSGKQCERAPLL